MRSGKSAILYQYVLVTLVVGTTGLSACRPGDVLSVPPSPNVVASSGVGGQAGAEGVYNDARYNVSVAFGSDGGLIEYAGLLADEFTASASGFSNYLNYVDARTTVFTGENEDGLTQEVFGARNALVSSVGLLEQYEPASGRAKIGEAYALIAYTELLLAEDYCGGATLTHTVFGGGFVYGEPLTTDSLLGTAEAHFDSAAAYANGNDTITSLAAVGMGRTLLNRGRYDSAAAAVANVSTDFMYGIPMATDYSQNGQFNMYQQALGFCSDFTVSDREGGNGLDFVSAGDPRLVLAGGLVETCDGVPYYGGFADSVFLYPMKFGNPSSMVPLATGVEARLIQAEAALQASDFATWAADLNSLRTNATSTYLQLATPMDTLPSDSTVLAADRVGTMFRERAFWLFGMGTRLGDLRRLVRQYGEDTSVVYPHGTYDAALQGNASWHRAVPLSTYGTDVDITLPTAQGSVARSNPHYKGCQPSTKIA